MVKLTGAFSKLKPFKVLVIGDFMLDKYTTGSVTRISPEAPVSILKVLKEEYLPGGAGNVVLNLVSLNATVCALGRIGIDDAGRILKKKLVEEGVDVQHIYEQKNYTTPLKNRLLGEGQQLLRVDQENLDILSYPLQEQICKALPSMLEDIQVVAISDYNKGFLPKDFLQEMMQLIKQKKIPVIVDPKGEDYSKYFGVDIIKPNLKEAYFAANAPSHLPLEEIVEKLRRQTAAKKILVTLSENGIALFDEKNQMRNFPVRAKEVKDVTGAGDTVLSVLCATVANGMDMDHAIQFTNIAAGIAIEKLGCARVTLIELAKRLLEEDLGNKIFDESHLFALKQILKQTCFALLSINTKDGIQSSLFGCIRKLRNSYDKLIIYVKDTKPDEEIINILSSLHEVDYIILKTTGKFPDFLHTEHAFHLEA